MDRKELAVVLLLVALVLAAATVRIFWGPVGADRTERPPVARKAGHGAGHENPSPALAVSIWPPPPEEMLPKDKAALRLFEAAETAGAEGLFGPAIQIYDHFLNRYPDEPACEIARLRMGQCATLAGQHRQAAEYYEKFVEAHPESPFLPLALLWCGESYLELGEPERARLRLAEVVAHHASSPFAKRAKARLEQLQGRKGAVPPRPPTTKKDSGAR